MPPEKKIMWNFQFHDKFVFRSPSFPFSDEIVTVARLREIVSDSTFLEAIYISSPALHSELLRWLKGETKHEKDEQKLIFSLNKYLSRIRTRCTPYGLFAGCSTGKWATTSEIQLEGNPHGHTRLDMDFVCNLTQQLSKHPSIEPWLLFYPNNSIYSIGNELRYVEYKYSGKTKSHVLKTIDKSEYVVHLLMNAANGMTLSSLEDLLVKNGINLEEAKNFVLEMVTAQLLVSELEPAVTGEEFMVPLINTLQNIITIHPSEELVKIHALLKTVHEKIRLLDDGENRDIKDYYDIKKELKELDTSISETTLFQVDTFRSTSVSTLSTSIQKKLIKVAEFLKNISQVYQNEELNKFKTKYREIYEEREMPLIQILDKESGIGYPDKDSNGVNPLVEDFILLTQANGGEGRQSLSQRDQFLFKKLLDAFKQEKYTINFRDEDVVDFNDNSERVSTVTISMMFKLIDAKKNIIQLNYIGGNSSAANILGRFAHGNSEVFDIIKDVTAFEKEVLEDKILAEIVHLPQDRVGNILLRPNFRDYEIPYLGKSAVPKEFQIPIEDILVSVKNNKIVLRSKRLNKEIMPRLSSAHNFGSQMSLPVYKFLGDIQLQDINMPTLMFHWGSLSQFFKFLPRAEYDDVILIPATWNLVKDDFEILTKNIHSTDLKVKMSEWKEKWKMPRFMLLKDGDNELFVDLESELSVKTFLDTVKKRQSIELGEFLFEQDSSLVKDKQQNSYTNEIIAVIFNNDYKKKVAEGVPEEKIVGQLIKKNYEIPIKRSFAPGSEWLYYKLYCGIKTADKILIQTIKPLVDILVRKGLIEKWFFIRYYDPDFHVRLRFYNRDRKKISEVLNIANQYFSPLMEQGLVSKIINDTYVRELERYGYNSIESSEEYFSLESASALKLLANAEGKKSEEIKLFFAYRSIDDLLDLLNFTPGEKLNYMEILKNIYITEHGGHKELKLRLDDKFRDMRKKVENILDKKNDNDNDFIGVVNLLSLHKLELLPIINSILEIHQKRLLSVSLKNLIGSYLHMNMNRIFQGKQRTYEMVIYDVLYRHYNSHIVRKRKSEHHKIQDV